MESLKLIIVNMNFDIINQSLVLHDVLLWNICLRFMRIEDKLLNKKWNLPKTVEAYIIIFLDCFCGDHITQLRIKNT